MMASFVAKLGGKQDVTSQFGNYRSEASAGSAPKVAGDLSEGFGEKGTLRRGSQPLTCVSFTIAQVRSCPSYFPLLSTSAVCAESVIPLRRHETAVVSQPDVLLARGHSV